MPHETLNRALSELSTEAAAAGRLPAVSEVARSARHRRRRAAGTFAIVALVTVATVAAVWPGGAGLQGPIPPAGEGEGTATEASPVSFYPPGVRVSADALLIGTLELIDGCLLVNRGSGELVVPVFSEASATWEGGALTTGQGRLEVGVDVGFGGGLAGDVRSDLSIPSSCPVDAPRWLVVG